MNKILAFFLFWASFSVQAQQFTVEVPSSVDQNDYFHLRYTIHSAEATKFTAPALSDFEILAGPSTSVNQNYSNINGRVTSSETTTYTFVLSPKRKGRFTISPASISVDGRTIRSRAVTIEVTGNGAKQAHPTGNAQSRSRQASEVMQSAGSSITERDLFLTVTPSRQRIYEQEAVLLTYKVHARVGVALANVGLSHKPDFKGLVSQEIPIKTISTTLERIGGASYKTGIVLQYVIFPQQPGELIIPAVTFDCSVVQQMGGMDMFDAFFNGGGNVGVVVKRAVKPLTLNVDALPQPRPLNFSGGVGRFNVKGELLTPHPKTNDIATYRITVNGTGNLKLITAPRLTFPKDFDSFDPKTIEKTQVTVDGLTGAMTYDYTFVPRNVGKYELPATAFVYFDTESNRYQTVDLQAIRLDVKQGERTKEDTDRELALRNSDLRAQHSIKTAHPVLTWGSVFYWLANLLLIAFYGLILRLLRNRIRAHADVVGSKRRKAGNKATKQLRKAAALLEKGRDAEFYAETSRALQRFVADKFNIGLAELTQGKIRALLSKQSVEVTKIDAFIALLDACEFARFAPAADADGKHEVYNTAIDLLEELDKALK